MKCKHDNVITLDFQGSYREAKLFSRMLWQKLFDIYREKGGKLTDLDNFLCDLDSFEDQFEKNWPKPLCWGALLNVNFTELVAEDMASCMTGDLRVMLTYTGKTMQLEILEPEIEEIPDEPRGELWKPSTYGERQQLRSPITQERRVNYQQWKEGWKNEP